MGVACLLGAIQYFSSFNSFRSFIALCLTLTNKADDCCEDQISSVDQRGHAPRGLDLHRDVLVGWDAVGLAQLQHRAHSWVVGAHTHHPPTIVEGLRGRHGSAQGGKFVFGDHEIRLSLLAGLVLVDVMAGPCLDAVCRWTGRPLVPAAGRSSSKSSGPS